MGKLKDSYNALPKRTGARPDFVNNISRVTMTSTGTVGQWLCGARKPSKLACKELARYFHCKEEEV